MIPTQCYFNFLCNSVKRCMNVTKYSYFNLFLLYCETLACQSSELFASCQEIPILNCLSLRMINNLYTFFISGTMCRNHKLD